jgi:hypothetical protein
MTQQEPNLRIGEAKRLGELTGIWVVLLKLTTVLTPLIITWAIWVTGNIYSGQKQDAVFQTNQAMLIHLQDLLQSAVATHITADGHAVALQKTTDALRRIERLEDKKP